MEDIVIDIATSLGLTKVFVDGVPYSMEELEALKDTHVDTGQG